MQRLMLLCLSICVLATAPIQADPGHPVAVRWWGQAMVSIETYWDLHIVIDPYGERVGYQDPNIAGDLVLITHEHGDHNNAKLVGGDPVVVHGLGEDGQVQAIDQVLDRLPNADKPWWKDARLRIARSQHAVRVQSVAAWHDDTQGSQRGADTLFVVEVDGVRIVHCGDLGQTRLTDEQLEALGKIDVLLIPVGGVFTVDGAQAADIVRQLQPRMVVPIHYKTPALAFDLQGVQGFLEAIENDYEVIKAKGNTLAVSAVEGTDQPKPQVVVLDYLPWQMPEDLEELFVAKEKACTASQEVFAKLSTEQMNFKPSNGTHTPRWNTEHMMGRELGFFTQIFANLDSQVDHLNLNPKQMPPDYVAAHPDWSGAEEARQMQRVTSLTRRFAYLLDGLDLDAQAPGSRWSLSGLLKQMDRHYGEHTANVQKKFELPDWPASDTPSDE